MRNLWLIAVALSGALSTALLAAEAKGVLTYESKGKAHTLELKHAYVIKVPDALNPKEMMRRVVFSPKDIADAIKACPTAQCVNGALADSLHVDLSTPFLPYWMVLDNQRVQYSGPAAPTALKLT